eukprot:Protomagalhaensia_sp_Gyna_25__4964@NODE_53_length_6056_cov_78_686222_g40_i0_p1_GENE_NODE_53_length_6056_cov_78_686222_g40_i0NODE_53_length_6056_cov_78_686222_g40_i0_p1_ORF_typecomplete_len573_score52_48DZR/PF12773_7/0_27DZR/PF12773_7/1_7DZR/PF12773_7/1_8e02zfRanBP/PF00641_18/0_037zfRanBP/PF00641_18/3_2e03zfRanBP/PF00641_18/6_5e03DUF2614/PF11023_8/2_2e02DUF2614/PF11023_8/1DUF2614/PF11023_8/2_8e03zfC2H2_12/PF18658_1/1_9e03zfC2H2_12/PF18658_1/1_9e02zfC2H2_12/PF18658_1/6_5_NODE_53_length_6056_cov_78
MPAKEWACGVCGAAHPGRTLVCSVCGTRRVLSPIARVVPIHQEIAQQQRRTPKRDACHGRHLKFRCPKCQHFISIDEVISCGFCGALLRQGYPNAPSALEVVPPPMQSTSVQRSGRLKGNPFEALRTSSSSSASSPPECDSGRQTSLHAFNQVRRRHRRGPPVTEARMTTPARETPKPTAPLDASIIRQSWSHELGSRISCLRVWALVSPPCKISCDFCGFLYDEFALALPRSALLISRVSRFLVEEDPTAPAVMCAGCHQDILTGSEVLANIREILNLLLLAPPYVSPTTDNQGGAGSVGRNSNIQFYSDRANPVETLDGSALPHSDDYRSVDDSEERGFFPQEEPEPDPSEAEPTHFSPALVGTQSRCPEEEESSTTGQSRCRTSQGRTCDESSLGSAHCSIPPHTPTTVPSIAEEVAEFLLRTRVLLLAGSAPPEAAGCSLLALLKDCMGWTLLYAEMGIPMTEVRELLVSDGRSMPRIAIVDQRCMLTKEDRSRWWRLIQDDLGVPAHRFGMLHLCPSWQGNKPHCALDHQELHSEQLLTLYTPAQVLITKKMVQQLGWMISVAALGV